jgi:hypothetical protein
MEKKIFTVAIIGLGGRGADAYGWLIHKAADRYKIVSLCDLRPERIEMFSKNFNVPKENCFTTEEEFFTQKRADFQFTVEMSGKVYACKMIGAMSAVLCGKVDAIILTGGLLRFADVAEGVRKHCGFIAPVATYPGEMEQEALALPALKALRGEIEPMKYTGRNVWNGFKEIGL